MVQGCNAGTHLPVSPTSQILKVHSEYRGFSHSGLYGHRYGNYPGAYFRDVIVMRFCLRLIRLDFAAYDHWGSLGRETEGPKLTDPRALLMDCRLGIYHQANVKTALKM